MTECLLERKILAAKSNSDIMTPWVNWNILHEVIQLPKNSSDRLIWDIQYVYIYKANFRQELQGMAKPQRILALPTFV